MATFPRYLKVNKTDSGTIDVSKWLSNETITSLTVDHADGLLTVNGSSFVGGLLSVSFTGVATGGAEVHFKYTTATRSDCYVAICIVVDDC